ncbi:MAG: hypothetical protein KDB07_05400, partial [Planctomycetes bacterium]|nr:hypothetical protein [Planctomycetota bacterium]
MTGGLINLNANPLVTTPFDITGAHELSVSNGALPETTVYPTNSATSALVLDLLLSDGGVDTLASTVTELRFDTSLSTADINDGSFTLHATGLPLAGLAANVVGNELVFSGLNIVVGNGVGTDVELRFTPVGGSLGSSDGDYYRVSIDQSDISVLTTGSQVTTSSASNGSGMEIDVVASKLTIGIQPGNGTAGLILTTQPTVFATDAFGNHDLDYTGLATAFIENDSSPNGAYLDGSNQRTMIGGFALYVDLRIDEAAMGYTLRFTAPGLAPAISTPFDISPSTASTMRIETQPGNGVAGMNLSTQPQLVIEDAFGNTVDDTGTQVSAVISTDPHGAAVLQGAAMIPSMNGIVDFTDLRID